MMPSIVDVKNSNLPFLIQLGAFKRRPDINGNWIREKEARLGHQIIPYRPTLEDGESN